MVIYMEPSDKDKTAEESMIWSENQRSLVRGRRRAPRTEVCRPCLVWRKESPADKFEGVALDLNRYGLRIRMIDDLPEGGEVLVQLMRDDEFQMPLGQPIQGRVVRARPLDSGLADHGVEVVAPDYRRRESRPVEIKRPGISQQREGRMHTVDITIGDRGLRGYGRRRGQ